MIAELVIALSGASGADAVTNAEILKRLKPAAVTAQQQSYRLEMYGSRDPLYFNQKYTSNEIPQLGQFNTLPKCLAFPEDFPNAARRYGMMLSEELIYFPSWKGTPYWSGALMQVNEGRVAILLPLREGAHQKMPESSPERKIVQANPDLATGKMPTPYGAVALTQGKVSKHTVETIVSNMYQAILSECRRSVR